MEEWQKLHIKSNLVELIKNTVCNVSLISNLQASNILHLEEVQGLQRQDLTNLEKSKKLYEILETRVDSYNILTSSLQQTSQSGALNILQGNQPVLRNRGCITYHKNQTLGKGSFGTSVYRGKFDGKEVAVKVLDCDHIDSSNAIREIDIYRKLDHHENIVRYYFAEGVNNLIYIALELCDISLEDQVKINLIDIKPSEVIRKCAAGVAHLHSQNILHRDIKPANVLLKRPDHVKISDFGLSKNIPVGAASVSAASGVVKGTMDYIAPEILNHISENDILNAPVRMSRSSDIFSLGCVFYFAMANGLHPFGSVFKRQFYITENMPQLDTSLMSPELLELIRQMIFHIPEKRPSAENILEMLKCMLLQNYTSSSGSINENIVEPETLSENINYAEAEHVDSTGVQKVETEISHEVLDNVASGVGCSNGQVETHTVQQEYKPPPKTIDIGMGIKVPRINAKTEWRKLFK